MPPKPFVDPFPLSTAQTAANAAAPAQPILPAPARQPIEPRTNPAHDWYAINYDEPEALTDLDASVDDIVLSGDAFTVKTRLHSGTIRTDRREASPEEIELMARDTRRRAANRYDLLGSSQPDTDIQPTSPFTKQEGI
jgi:hypothetical protein